MYGYFKNISWSYAESVFIDGGGHMTVFLKIMLPIAKPVVTALIIIGIIAAWNDYSTPLMFLPAYPTLAVGMYGVSSVLPRSGNSPAYFAALIISTIPVIIFFAAFSDIIMSNLTIGGLKG